MAHQCWNDGTDRSTLPIHGMSVIGIYGKAAEPEVAQLETFFKRAKKGCQSYSLVATSAVTVIATGILSFEAVTFTVDVGMM
jgi:hypothetical protein